MRRNAFNAAIMFVAFAVVSPAAAQSDDAARKGEEIALRADRSDNGFSDSRAELRMILRNRAGDKTERLLMIDTLERESERLGDKTLIVFSSPPDVEGTALLSHARLIEPDDQWLYLPELKRVKRISSVNKSGPFLGSEFSFEDFTAQEAGKFTHVWLREEACGELTCDVIERTPSYEHSGYTKQIVWIDKDAAQFRRIEFYDRTGAHFKTLAFEDYRLYDERFWRSHLLEMVNHVSGKSTDLQFSEIEFGNGMTDRDFERGALSRRR